MNKKIIIWLALLIWIWAIRSLRPSDTSSPADETDVVASQTWQVLLPEITWTIKQQLIAHSAHISRELQDNLWLDTVEIKREKCDEENAFYDPESKQITVCDEMIDALTKYGQKESEDVAIQEEIAVNSTLFFLMHELWHAYIDLYKLPITWKEEDVADQIATYLILTLNKDNSYNMVMDGAFSFYEFSQQNPDIDDGILSDVHSIDKQRFYNIACRLYGATNEEEIIKDRWLPQERADGCTDEYNLIKSSLETLLTAKQTANDL